MGGYFTKRLMAGDCLVVLHRLDDGSIDSIVTDPPYELGFMGKKWDASGIAYSAGLWAECLRVLKPGGHLLAFGGTRTSHRMVCAIEDAGFEVRDSIHWTYGSGFPKSLDVSKAIDKQKGNQAEVYRFTAWVRAARDAAGITNKEIDVAFGFAGMAGHWTSSKAQPAVPTLEQLPELLALLGVDELPEAIRELALRLNEAKGQPGPAWFKREIIGTKISSLGGTVAAGERDAEFIAKHKSMEFNVTAPATPAAGKWAGWGTALKPSHEPIVVARKPLRGTVAGNVLAHGTGGLNIDACRVGSEGRAFKIALRGTASHGGEGFGSDGDILTTEALDWESAGLSAPPAGRWPSNTILTHAAACIPWHSCVEGCPAAELDQQSGPAGASRFFTQANWDEEWDGAQVLYVAKPSKRERNAGLDTLPTKGKVFKGASSTAAGQAAGSVEERFSTTPTANSHPTVKPVALMRHLVRLVTPPGGTVLDPFLGSGTTAVAAVLEGMEWRGCEMTEDYLPIVKGRVAHARREHAKVKQQPLPGLPEQDAP